MPGRSFHLVSFASSLALAACAARPSPVIVAAPSRCAGDERIVTASGAPSSSPPPVASSSAPGPTREEQAVDAALALAREAFVAHRSEQIESALASARAAAGSDEGLHDRIARLEAAFAMEAGDVAAATRLLAARVENAEHAGSLRAFGLRDGMIFLREAASEPLLAYLEAEAMRSLADLPTVDPSLRARLRLGYTWQRAHTLRNLAETLQGEQRVVAIATAETTRAQFAQLAREAGRSLASIEVLSEQFATLDGHRDEALAAAGRLDLSTLDGQDLYLTLRAYLAAHDDEGAARVRAVIDADHDIDLLTSTYRWMSRRALAEYAASSAPPSASAAPGSRTRARRTR